MSSDEPRKTGFPAWVKFGYANRPAAVTKCGICGSSFAYDKYPETGDSMNCPHCDAEGYGTYDQGGYYMLEWYEGENGS